MKVVVTGATGNVGTSVVEALAARAEVGEIVGLARRRPVRRINVDGSRRVFEAAGRAGVPKLIHASSVGAYSPGPKDRAVEETWPTGGTESSFYSRIFERTRL